jgi:hypothetical protein
VLWGLPSPRSTEVSPDSVARAIFDGVERGEDEIFPDPVSETMADGWRGGATKALEREFAALVAYASSPSARRRSSPATMKSNPSSNWAS